MPTDAASLSWIDDDDELDSVLDEVLVSVPPPEDEGAERDGREAART